MVIRRKVNRYKIKDTTNGTRYYPADVMENYTVDELIKMGCKPDEAEEIAKFMNTDTKRQQRSWWNRAHKSEVPNNDRSPDLRPLEKWASRTKTDLPLPSIADGTRHIQKARTDWSDWDGLMLSR